ncbi:MAG: FixH family protein [Rhodocyclales bacterium]|nr:FixH family protein [Rhodocyclales bacterium]
MSLSAPRTAIAAPWYRQRWPWILIAIPAASVLAGMLMLYLALSTWDGLVVDDYYRQGKAIHQVIARSARAAELGLAADLSVTAERVSVRLGASDPASLPDLLVVSITHPTRGGHDQKLRLRGRDGVYDGEVAPLTAGRWKIQLEDGLESWRLNDEISVPTSADVRIRPYGS